MMSIDLAIFHAINDAASSNALTRSFAVFFATYLVFAALAYGAVVLARAWRDQASRLVLVATWIRALVAATLGNLGNLLVSFLLFRPRPFATLGMESLIGSPLTTKSFPSDHATLAFAVAATFAFSWPHRGWAFFSVAALVALGRVMVGVHYPTDVLAGAIVGLCWAWIVETVDVRGGGALSLRIARVLTRHRV